MKRHFIPIQIIIHFVSFSRKLICFRHMSEFVSFVKKKWWSRISGLVAIYSMLSLFFKSSGFCNVAVCCYNKETLFSPPALILAWATSTRVAQLTIWMLNLNTMTHQCFTFPQWLSVFVSSCLQNSGCLEIRLISLFFSRLYTSFMTLSCSYLTKMQNKSTSLLKYFVCLSTLRSRYACFTICLFLEILPRKHF